MIQRKKSQGFSLMLFLLRSGRQSLIRGRIGLAASYATKTIYVGNIPWGTEEGEFQDFVETHGKVDSIRLPKDSMGRIKGFGFIDTEEENVDKLVEGLNGADFNGRTLIVNESKPREERPPFRNNRYRSD